MAAREGRMELDKKPADRRERAQDAWSDIDRECAIRFLLNVINATICSSGEDYDGALRDFFPQIEALGHLIGARNLDDVTLFLRSRCRIL